MRWMCGILNIASSFISTDLLGFTEVDFDVMVVAWLCPILLKAKWLLPIVPYLMNNR
jgi:hypothetical protein